ncbi:NADH-ubiquinone oxidoreductase chain [Trichinella spiralis]|uniref:NADH dehydrogenase subunit 5 n=1 Tax=Trichinella spiralis TaxID=6334 RepID=A0ABR3K4T4_TRISP
MTTIMMNRVGDFALMVMVVTLGCSFVFDYEYVVYSSLRLVMFLGAMIAKRAQVPMRRWLPIAMAAPTPVAMVMLMLLSGIYSLMVIHIVNHALVKALLFMNVGIIMRYMFANQEVRMVTCVGYNVGFVLGRVILCLVEDTLFHLVNVVLFMSVMYSLRMIYVLMGGLSVIGFGCSDVVGVIWVVPFSLSFTMNNWLSMWTMLELTTWVIMVIIVEELSSSEGVSWVNMWFLTVVHKVVPFVVSMLVVDSVLIGVVCVVSILWSVFRWLWLASSDLRSRVRGIVIL